MQIVHAPPLPVRDDWLALREESALQPNLPIVDAPHPQLRRDVEGNGHRIVPKVDVQGRPLQPHRRYGPRTGSRRGPHAYINIFHHIRQRRSGAQ